MTVPTKLRGRLHKYEGYDVMNHGVVWYPERWKVPALGRLGQLVDDLAVATREADSHVIRRRHVFDARSRGNSDLFAASMIWGFGDRNYGPRRVEFMLGTAKAHEKIEGAARVLETDGAVEAHRYMINARGRISWCRTPFISKFLYFAGFGAVDGAQPLIFDAVVQERLTEAGLDLRLHYTDDYAQYLTTAADWARELQLPRADLVEVALFRS